MANLFYVIYYYGMMLFLLTINYFAILLLVTDTDIHNYFLSYDS